MSTVEGPTKAKFRLFACPGRQHGSAAILMVVFVLVLLTIITLLSSELATLEQRTAANERRERQAFEAAMTAYSHALAQLFESRSVATPADPALRPAAPGGGTYAVEFCRIVVAGGVLQQTLPTRPTDSCVTPADGADKRVLIYARGWSDDQSGVHHIVAVAERTSAFPAGPASPVTARGLTGINGSGDVTNPEGRLTIWSGGDTNFTNANFKTNILSPSWQPDPDNWRPPVVIESSSMGQSGLDVVANDGNLRNLTGAQFFEAFMGHDRASYPDLVGADQFPPNAFGGKAGPGSNNRILWSAGNTTSSGNPTFGSAGSGLDPTDDSYIQPGATGYATPEPVVVIIDGDFNVSGTVTVNGLLYVKGTLSGSGNLRVNGAVIVEGDVNVTGSIDILYSSLIIETARGLGRAATIPGSWKDWVHVVGGNPV